MSTEAPYQFRWLDRLVPEHAERYLGLYLRVLERDSTVGFPGPFEPAVGQKIVADLNRDLSEKRCHLLVADTGSSFLFQGTLIQSGSPNNRHMAGVFRAMVDPEVRGHGVMWRTLPAFISKCRELGVELVYLDVRAGSPAEQIWKHMGFKVFGVLPGYSRVDGQLFDGIYMYLSVAEAFEIARKRNLL
ncbi:GNAT family N-acetyltransferase [Hyalangium versicolor]|uniref:GNAT family N-acetyltransferase n=1 Tax=Hyalangium versicolor TaxID=2861190 RepID=UPI001CCE0937|nr:GNAT family N-acetyltransferase [Hyalangium versicolor]